MTDAVIMWRRLDLPGHESARLASRDGRRLLTGTALFVHAGLPCRLDYSVVCSSAWHTISAKVEGWVGRDEIEIEVAVDSSRSWQLNGRDAPAVAGCIDIDLNFSPSTNLLPIRRLDLPVGRSATVTAAWLRFPSFQLEPLAQVYRHIGDRRYRYQSAGGGSVRDLAVNEAGFVTHYPDFFVVEDAP